MRDPTGVGTERHVALRDLRNETDYSAVPERPGLMLLHADFTNHEYVPHVHDGFVIAATEAGGAVLTSRKRTVEARAATLFVSNPYEPQASSMGRSRRWRYRSLYIEPPAIDRLQEALGLTTAPYFERSLLEDRALVAEFLRLHAALYSRGDSLQQDELLFSFLARLVHRHAADGLRLHSAPRQCATLRTALDLMHARYREALRLEELGAATGLTANQLIDLFKRSVGLTPHTYLTQVRLHAARRFLRQGYRIADAAGAAGFYDQSALTRHFKRCYGITPLQFIRAVAG